MSFITDNVNIKLAIAKHIRHPMYSNEADRAATCKMTAIKYPNGFFQKGTL